MHLHWTRSARECYLLKSSEAVRKWGLKLGDLLRFFKREFGFAPSGQVKFSFEFC